MRRRLQPRGDGHSPPRFELRGHRTTRPTRSARGRTIVGDLTSRRSGWKPRTSARSTHTGEFDYIVAHGVYSWVPAEVRTPCSR